MQNISQIHVFAFITHCLTNLVNSNLNLCDRVNCLNTARVDLCERLQCSLLSAKVHQLGATCVGHQLYYDHVLEFSFPVQGEIKQVCTAVTDGRNQGRNRGLSLWTSLQCIRTGHDSLHHFLAYWTASKQPKYSSSWANSQLHFMLGHASFGNRYQTALPFWWWLRL